MAEIDTEKKVTLTPVKKKFQAAAGVTHAKAIAKMVATSTLPTIGQGATATVVQASPDTAVRQPQSFSALYDANSQTPEQIVEAHFKSTTPGKPHSIVYFGTQTTEIMEAFDGDLTFFHLPEEKPATYIINTSALPSRTQADEYFEKLRLNKSDDSLYFLVNQQLFYLNKNRQAYALLGELDDKTIQALKHRQHSEDHSIYVLSADKQHLIQINTQENRTRMFLEIVASTMDALMQFHSKSERLCHLDIKNTNILFRRTGDQHHLQLTDFPNTDGLAEMDLMQFKENLQRKHHRFYLKRRAESTAEPITCGWLKNRKTEYLQIQNTRLANDLLNTTTPDVNGRIYITRDQLQIICGTEELSKHNVQFYAPVQPLYWPPQLLTHHRERKTQEPVGQMSDRYALGLSLLFFFLDHLTACYPQNIATPAKKLKKTYCDDKSKLKGAFIEILASKSSEPSKILNLENELKKLDILLLQNAKTLARHIPDTTQREAFFSVLNSVDQLLLTPENPNSLQEARDAYAKRLPTINAQLPQFPKDSIYRGNSEFLDCIDSSNSKLKRLRLVDKDPKNPLPLDVFEFAACLKTLNIFTRYQSKTFIELDEETKSSIDEEKFKELQAESRTCYNEYLQRMKAIYSANPSLLSEALECLPQVKHWLTYLQQETLRLPKFEAYLDEQLNVMIKFADLFETDLHIHTPSLADFELMLDFENGGVFLIHKKDATYQRFISASEDLLPNAQDLEEQLEREQQFSMAGDTTNSSLFSCCSTSSTSRSLLVAMTEELMHHTFDDEISEDEAEEDEAKEDEAEKEKTSFDLSIARRP